MSTGSTDPGFCLWTFQDGTWTSENHCMAGFTCSMPPGMAAPRAPGPDPQQPPYAGIPDEIFRAHLSSRGIALADEADQVETPCIPSD